MFLAARLALSASLALLGAASCVLGGPDPDDIDPPEGSAVVTVRISPPPAQAGVSSYALDAAGPGGATVELESKGPLFRYFFTAGSWSVAVRGLNAAGTAVLSGAATFVSEPGAARDLSVELGPPGGTARLRLSFALPPDAPADSTVDLEIEPLSGGAPVVHNAPWDGVELPLAAGFYLLSVRLRPPGPGSPAPGGATALFLGPGLEATVVADLSLSTAEFSFVGAGAGGGDPGFSLPCWIRRSESIPLALEHAGAVAPRERWTLDGADAAASAVPGRSRPSLPGPLALGVHRLDCALWSPDGLWAASGSARFLLRQSYSAGAWAWEGDFSPPAETRGGLSADGSFIAVAASADGSSVAALETADPGSSVHWFDLTPDGSPFHRRSAPVRSDGAERSCDRLVLSPDGAHAAVWKTDSAWAALGPASAASFTHLEADPFGGGSPWRVRDAVFSADSGILYLLSGPAPYRVVALSVAAGAPAYRWTLSLDDPRFASTAFTALAVSPAGGLLAASLSGDALACYAPPAAACGRPSRVAAIFKRTTTGPSWLDGPVDAVALDDGSFLVLCSDSGTVGRFGAEGAGTPFGERLTDASAAGSLTGSSRLAAAPGGGRFAATGARGPESPLPRRLVVFDRGLSAPPSAVFSESDEGSALGRAADCAWLSDRRILAAGSSGPSVSSFCLSP
jgi:hypothetical protein